MEPQFDEQTENHPQAVAWISESFPNNEKIYYFLCCLWYLLREINPETKFVEKLKALFVKYPNTPLDAMGFPDNWESEKFWQ